MTYRERRHAKAARLRDWADRRDAKAKAAEGTRRQIADMIPLGQPILVGHHSEGRHRRDLDRMDRAMGASIEHAGKAKEFRSRADNIEAAADAAIYSDDPDAVERLVGRIATLEDERDRVKRFNASARKGDPDWSILTDGEVAGLRTVVKVMPVSVTDKAGKFKGFPPYHLANLSGNIKRQRDRLTELQRRAENVATAEAGGGVVIRQHGPNRATLTFSEKPDDEVRAGLREHGFRWVRAQGCWSGSDVAYAQEVAQGYGEG